MFKVLIADDEEKVCQLIKNLISWEELGLEVMACANDGISALDIIKQSCPDLVITDIRMPGYDGIDLIKRAKEINQNIEFIIISGYKHFDYAHNAIKFGVEDYLLKPLKKNEFINALKKTVKKLESRDRQYSKNELIEIQMANDKKKLRTAFMVDILFNRDDIDNSLNIDTINNEYHFSFRPGNFQVVIVKADMGFKEDNKNVDKLLTDKAVEIIHKYLKPVMHELVVYCSNTGIYCILNYDSEIKNNIRKLYKYIIDEISTLRDLFSDLKITIGTGTVASDIDGLNESLNSAKEAINARIILNTGRVIEGQNLKDDKLNVATSNFLDSDLMKLFARYTETLEVEGIREWLDGLCEKLKMSDDISGNLVLNISNEIIDLFMFNLKKQSIDMKEKTKFLRSYNEKIHKCSSVEEIFDMLTAEITQQMKSLLIEKQYADIKPIREAKLYMQKNYNSAISLEDVSNVIGFNATYFSYFFKKETGMNFLEYLADIRVSKAKELLVDSSFSVAEIAEAVGYMDLKHFSKLFKKFTGLTPSEYRKIYQ